MRLYMLAGLLGSFVACTPFTTAAETSDASTATAATDPTLKLASGQHEDLALVVDGTHVSGSYIGAIGDPTRGGATCSFTFSGTVQTIEGVEQARIAAVDGYDATTGVLTAITEKGAVGAELRLDKLLNACERVAPWLASPDGGADIGLEPLPAGVVGFRSAAKKTFFYDGAGGDPRAAYVIQGDIVSVMGPEENGFLPVAYKATKGFVKLDDLMAENAP